MKDRTSKQPWFLRASVEIADFFWPIRAEKNSWLNCSTVLQQTDSFSSVNAGREHA
jgi:hypothetical protein